MASDEVPRGKLPGDERELGADAIARMRLAAEEVAWITGRGYPLDVVTAMVAKRHDLTPRQFTAVERGICSDPQYRRRAVREADPEDLQRRPIRIDTENLLVTVEVALAGGPLLQTLDGTVRDLVWTRGAHRPVDGTDAALELVGASLRQLRPSTTRWYLGADAAGTAALGERVAVAARRWKLPVEVKVVPSVAETLGKAAHVVSSDPIVLDACTSWFNLAAPIARGLASAWVLSLQ